MNPERILIDTSAWIMGFKKSTAKTILDFINESIPADLVVTTPLIILELVQGFKTSKKRDDLPQRLDSLNGIDITPGIWKVAYALAFSLRRKR